MTAKGLSSPSGYLWARYGDGSGNPWHVVRVAELPPEGARHRSARSVCGLWGSLLPGRDGWAEVVERAPEPGRFCHSCLASVADVRRALRPAAQEPPAEQGRLF